MTAIVRVIKTLDFGGPSSVMLRWWVAPSLLSLWAVVLLVTFITESRLSKLTQEQSKILQRSSHTLQQTVQKFTVSSQSQLKRLNAVSESKSAP